jgi:MFS transporter, AAHS family, 4-hydroxybenzoate transporter
MEETAAIDNASARAPGIDIAEFINQARIGPFQLLVFAQCVLVSMLDGFATQSIAFVAPAIAADWKIAPASFGPIFSATALGSIVGAMLGGPLADRFGRKIVMVLSVAIFAGVSLATIYAGSVHSLVVMRLLTGLGLGAALPNLISLATEYAPQRRRSTIVAITLWGFPLGAALGGAVSAHLIAQFGWSTVFLLSGIVSLLFLPILMFRLPESIMYLALRSGTRGAIVAILARIDPTYRLDPASSVVLPERVVAGNTLGAIFRGPLAAATLLLSVAMLASLSVTYCVLNWIPSLLHQEGLPIQDAVMGTVIFNFSGILGSYFLTRLADRGSPLPLMASVYVLGALSVAMIGVGGASFWRVMVATFFAGLFIIGSQLSITAFVSSYYPTAVRGTAIGWSIGFGRFGQILGPLAGGFALAMGVQPRGFFQLLSVPVLIAASALYALFRILRNRGNAR